MNLSSNERLYLWHLAGEIAEYGQVHHFSELVENEMLARARNQPSTLPDMIPVYSDNGKEVIGQEPREYRKAKLQAPTPSPSPSPSPKPKPHVTDNVIHLFK